MAGETTPSQVVPPAGTDSEQRLQASASSPVTGIDTSPQQASAPPDAGSEIRAEQIKKPSEVNQADPDVNVVELPPRSPTFKEQVYGYARLVRGTMLGRPDVKEQGTKVLRGEQGIPMRRDSQSSK
ncbi:hypothetical protein L210DRAFT_1058753 [Boletus edulis BED1]|uniref:Uncharacterized protein n=1 Tax=Boletus edulis BED1 TaxID=1328754 RepID=A0AAD4BZ24_BOLED|nr:hypothetical protein L210DRAFT_1058753 [Boletus edulis BED1]